MAKALKLIYRMWAWLERYGAERAVNDRRIAEYVERRRREIVRRTAARMGSY